MHDEKLPASSSKRVKKKYSTIVQQALFNQVKYEFVCYTLKYVCSVDLLRHLSCLLVFFSFCHRIYRLFNNTSIIAYLDLIISTILIMGSLQWIGTRAPENRLHFRVGHLATLPDRVQGSTGIRRIAEKIHRPDIAP